MAQSVSRPGFSLAVGQFCSGARVAPCLASWQRHFFQCPKWFDRSSFDCANIVKSTRFCPPPLFFFLQGNAGHHEGHLRHDGEVHVPHPQRGDSTPARWSFLPGEWADCTRGGTNFERPLSWIFRFSFSLWQKMDKNKDGVVTIDEFIDCCQNVSWRPAGCVHTKCSNNLSSTKIMNRVNGKTRHWVQLISTLSPNKTSLMICRR